MTDTTYIYDMPDTEYRKARGITQSGLKTAITPAHYKAMLDAPKQEPTPAMIFGSILHATCLEPHRLAEMSVIKPDGMKFTTKDGKEWKESQTKAIITAEDAANIKGAADALRSHPIAAKFLAFKKEVSVFATHEETGMKVKGRLDLLGMVGDSTVVADIKTTEDASLDGFSRAITHFRYDLQAAFYMDMTGASNFVFIAVEKEPPYAVGVYDLDPDSIEVGRKTYARRLLAIKEAQQSGKWDAYPETIQTISIQGWLNRKENAV